MKTNFNISFGIEIYENKSYIDIPIHNLQAIANHTKIFCESMNEHNKKLLN